MFYEFAHRHTPCTIDGVADAVILSRNAKSSNVIDREYMFVGRFSPVSTAENGSLVLTTDSFFIEATRITTDNDKYCSLVKLNATIEVWRYAQPESGDPDFFLTDSAIAYIQFVNADLRKQEPGLLATTEYILVVQKTVDVKKPNDATLYKPDRVVFNSLNYKVDVVDDVKIPNLYHIQLSVDYR